MQIIETCIYSAVDPLNGYEETDPVCNKEGKNKLVVPSECVSSDDENHYSFQSDEKYSVRSEAAISSLPWETNGKDPESSQSARQD